MVLKIFLDMDGVLVDFVGGLNTLWNLQNCPYSNPINLGRWDYEEVTGIGSKSFWASLTSDFFANARKTHDADEIVEYLEERFGWENICILSSPPNDPTSMVGKHQWLVEHYPQYKRQFFFGTKKNFAAHKGSLLVDDADHNIDSFIKAGGQGFLYPRPWNTAFPHRDRAIDRLKEYAKSVQC